MRAILSSGRHPHDPGYHIVRGVEQPWLEQPARVDALKAAVRELGLETIQPRDFGMEPILEVHDPNYVAFLQSAYPRWQELRDQGFPASPTVQSSGFTLRDRHRGIPAAISAQVDYYLAGGWAPLAETTYDAAVEAAHCAIEGAEELLAGALSALALCRPPGHHAYADLAGGFCYLNNVAVAAHRLAHRLGRVAILDIDAHHGNGTQSIFYDRADVLFVSIHADPVFAYPYYCGFADEVGEGAGRGFNLNLPLPKGADDGQFLAALDEALGAVKAFAPAALLVSLGLDASIDDPTALLSVTPKGFEASGAAIGTLNLPTLIVQEGGYDLGGLASSLRHFVGGYRRLNI